MTQPAAEMKPAVPGPVPFVVALRGPLQSRLPCARKSTGDSMLPAPSRERPRRLPADCNDPRGGTGCPDPLTPAALAEARALRERALADDTAYELMRSLTTEVGPAARRLAGRRARRGAGRWPSSRRSGSQRARRTGDRAALDPRRGAGRNRGAVATGARRRRARRQRRHARGGIEAEVVPVASLDDLKAQPRERIAGRIVFFTTAWSVRATAAATARR